MLAVLFSPKLNKWNKVFAHKQSISGIPNQIKTKMATKSSRTGDRIKIEEDE